MTITPARLALTGSVLTAGFGLLHVHWALGGRLGLPGDQTVTGRPWFLAYDIASAVGLFAAAALAPRLAGRPGPRLARIALLGTVLVLARGAVGLVQDAATVVAGHAPGWSALFDVWFVVAGAVFLPLVLHARRSASGAPGTQPTGSASPRVAASTSPVAPALTPRRPSTTT